MAMGQNEEKESPETRPSFILLTFWSVLLMSESNALPPLQILPSDFRVLPSGET